MMMDEYELDEQQVKVAKRAAKREGANRGVPWAYHRQSGYFRCSPSNSPSITKEMIDYGYDQWARSGVSLSDLNRGAIGIGHVSEWSGNEAIQKNNEIVRTIRVVPGGMEYL